jgi:hypothetical protein
MVGYAYPTSYFSTPSTTLDPTLFEGKNLRSQIRIGIVSLLNNFLGQRYRHSEIWAHAWLAGSGVSYQWEASRQPGDLDCLVGVNYVQFRKANPEYAGLTDSEVSSMINEQFYGELQPTTSNWNGYELTFYVNPGATDIRSIKPYAAYDLKYDEWTVTPSPLAAPPAPPSWETSISNDKKMSDTISTRFTTAFDDVKNARDNASRRNAETRLEAAMSQGVNMYEDIHMGRRLAFSSSGEGYGDYHNYRWQASKRDGFIHSLKKIRDYAIDSHSAQVLQQYGVELPTTQTLIRRAATYRNTL